MRTWYSERNAAIYEMWRGGASLDEICRHYWLCGEAIYQVIRLELLRRNLPKPSRLFQRAKATLPRKRRKNQVPTGALEGV